MCSSWRYGAGRSFGHALLQSITRRVSRSVSESVKRIRCVHSLFVCWLVAIAPASFAASIPGLFNTGVGTNGVVLATGAIDPHYKMVQSADASFPGPNAIVVNDQLFPIVGTGPWLPTTAVSKWIGPQANQSTGNQFGDYVFRVTVDLTGFDAATVVISGRWSSDNAGSDILLNGVSTGNSNPAQFAGW